MSAHQNHRFLVAFPKDTATPEDKQRRRFAASPIDTATPERGLAASPIDTATPKEKRRLMCCSFPHRHGIYDAKTTRKTMRKRREKRRDDQLEANKGLAPRPPDYKREPFVTHSGKSTAWHTLIQALCCQESSLKGDLFDRSEYIADIAWERGAGVAGLRWFALGLGEAGTPSSAV